jgi:hypothetical protein
MRMLLIGNIGSILRLFEEESMFFFEKKNQKTFVCLGTRQVNQ